jgi:hypothetical protein
MRRGDHKISASKIEGPGRRTSMISMPGPNGQSTVEWMSVLQQLFSRFRIGCQIAANMSPISVSHRRGPVQSFCLKLTAAAPQ